MLATLFDHLTPPASTALTSRTPRRGEGYAAQVWAEEGHWDLGTNYTTTREARKAAEAFAALRPEPPATRTPREHLPDGWNWRRSESHAGRHKYVRKVKGPNTWQARPWIGKQGGSLNLGLFSSEDHGELAEWAAAQVARAFVREWKGTRTVGEVVEMLKNAPKASERVPAHVEVPPAQRDLRPPTDYGPQKTAAAQREERQRRLITLEDFLAPITREKLAVAGAGAAGRREHRAVPQLAP